MCVRACVHMFMCRRELHKGHDWLKSDQEVVAYVFFFLNTFLILRYSLFSFLNVTSVEGLTYALLQAKCLF